MLKFQIMHDLRGTVKFLPPRPGDVGFDLRAGEDAVILPGQQCSIRTGLKLEIPPGLVGRIVDRSGIARKHQVYVVAGKIDPAYRGEITILLHNHGHAPLCVEVGHRIAQLVFERVAVPTLVEVADTELTPTLRGSNGFGSTGV